MLRRVARGGHRPQRQPADIELLAAAHAAVGEFQVRSARGEQLRAAGGQLAAPRDEVGV
jgi:hypothetical protein